MRTVTNERRQPVLKILLVATLDHDHLIGPLRFLGLVFGPLRHAGLHDQKLAREWVVHLAPDRLGQRWTPTRKRAGAKPSNDRTQRGQQLAELSAAEQQKCVPPHDRKAAAGFVSRDVVVGFASLPLKRRISVTCAN